MKILSLFSHHHVVSNPCWLIFLCTTQNENLEEHPSWNVPYNDILVEKKDTKEKETNFFLDSLF